MKYEIYLGEDQRQELLDIIKKGSAKARTIRRAHTLLMAADGKKDETIAETLHISVATIERTRKQFCCEDLERIRTYATGTVRSPLSSILVLNATIYEIRPFSNSGLTQLSQYIACAMLVWLRLKNLAYKTGQTIYQIKHNLLSNYLIEQLKRPEISMSIV